MLRSLVSRRIASRAITVRVSSLSRQFSSLNLPPNLTIADESVFAKPNDPVIPRREFYFPPLHVPETAPIKKFLDSKTGPIGEARLDRTVFGVAIRHDIVHEAVRYERHLFRQPHKSKRSFEISGSTKKPYAQKGTGKAQAGNKRASHWKGGQKAHGPKLRSFAIGMNKKQRALALMISLAAKQREGNLIIFDNFDVSSHRTQDLVAILESHGLAESKAIVIDEEIKTDFECACRNLPLLLPLAQKSANVFDIVRREKLLITAPALERLQRRLVSQYTHIGGRAAILRGLDLMTNHPGFAKLSK